MTEPVVERATHLRMVRRPPGPVVLAKVVTTVRTQLPVPDHGRCGPHGEWADA